MAEPLGQGRPVLALVEQYTLASPGDPYLSLAALESYSGLGRKTLRGFLDRTPPAQALPCFRLDGKILVRRSDFDNFMLQFRAQGRPALVGTLRRLGLDRPV